MDPDLICTEFLDNPYINPETGRNIKIDGPTFNSLVNLCRERNYDYEVDILLNKLDTEKTLTVPLPKIPPYKASPIKFLDDDEAEQFKGKMKYFVGMQDPDRKQKFSYRFNDEPENHPELHGSITYLTGEPYGDLIGNDTIYGRKLHGDPLEQPQFKLVLTTNKIPNMPLQTEWTPSSNYQYIPKAVRYGNHRF